MSARRGEPTDSDGSWTWVDNEDDNFRKRAASRRASSYTRAEVEELKDSGESDVSILTDPEDNPEGDKTKAVPTEPEIVPEADKVEQPIPIPVKSAVARADECEIAVIEREARAYLQSTMSSAFLMIFSLLVALYCQWGSDANVTSPIQEYYDSQHHISKAARDIEYIADYGNKYKQDNYDKYKYATHKNAKHDKRQEYDHYDEHEHKDKKQKKGDVKHKNNKEKKNNNVKKEKTHRKSKDSNEHEDYLHKKEVYLKQKEGKLNQKEFKLYAKDKERKDKQQPSKKQKKFNKHNETSSGEWYENMHKGRKDKRKQEEQSDWMFERAQGRNKKRDKAHWYFDRMDERETNRVKKS